MNSLVKLVFAANLLFRAFWAQWPIGVSYTDILWSEGYSYTSFTNLKIVNGFAWNDNSWAYTL